MEQEISTVCLGRPVLNAQGLKELSGPGVCYLVDDGGQQVVADAVVGPVAQPVVQVEESRSVSRASGREGRVQSLKEVIEDDVPSRCQEAEGQNFRMITFRNVGVVDVMSSKQLGKSLSVRGDLSGGVGGRGVI